jgi:hypothetical protein
VLPHPAPAASPAAARQCCRGCQQPRSGARQLGSGRSSNKLAQRSSYDHEAGAQQQGRTANQWQQRGSWLVLVHWALEVGSCAKLHAAMCSVAVAAAGAESCQHCAGTHHVLVDDWSKGSAHHGCGITELAAAAGQIRRNGKEAARGVRPCKPASKAHYACCCCFAQAPCCTHFVHKLGC